MIQDSILVTYIKTGYSHNDLTNADGNGSPEMYTDTIVETYAISDTNSVYCNGGDEFVEIIKIEPISDSNSLCNIGILVGLVVLSVFLLKKLLK